MDIKKWLRGDRRPAPITVVCIIGFPTFVFLIFETMLPRVYQRLDLAYGPFFFFLAITGFALGLMGLEGYWRMRRWGVYCYALTFVLNAGIALHYQVSMNLLNRLGPLAVLCLGIFYFRKMK